MTTIFFFFSLFFSSLALWFDIEVPVMMKGAGDSSQKMIKYSLKGTEEMVKMPSKRMLSPQTIEDFMSHIIWCYRSDKVEDFLELFTPETKALVLQDRNVFEESWQILSQIKKPFIDHYYEYAGGYVVSWGDVSLPVN